MSVGINTYMNSGTTVAEDWEIKRVLLVEGTGWVVDNNRTFMQASELEFAPSLWFQFVSHNISPIAHDNLVPRKWCLLLFCIVRDLPINVGWICRDLIEDATVQP